ncbi:MAG: phosphate ABC transporter substrate-binding protein, partial [Carnobacterium sp.]
FRFYSTEMVGNDEIKLLSINGVTPSKETIRTGEYPISSEFYAITAGTDNPNIQPFIDWILSAEGQAIVEKVGYVPVTK